MPFETVALDFITKLPLSQGYDSILTVTDHDCTKAAIFIPCNVTCAPVRDRQTAKRKQKASAEEWIKSEDGVMERMTGPNGVYVRYVSAPADDEEQDYAVQAGAMIT